MRSNGDYADLKGPAFVLSGDRIGSSTYNQNLGGFYWSSTAYYAGGAYSLYLVSSSSVNPASNEFRKYYGFTVRCVADDPPLEGITTMQEMTPGIVAATTTGASNTLTDTRDNSTYTVKKLKDGKIWMTQNLRLAGPKTLTAADSNVISDFNLLAPTSSGTAWCKTNDSGCDDQSMSIDSGNTDYGFYYNWYTATAGNGKFSTSSGGVSYDICPKGWRLPTGNSYGDFNTLYASYGSTPANIQAGTDPNFVLSGYRYGGSTSNQGSSGSYWSSTARTSSYTYDLYLESSDVNPADYSYKYFGFSVRCIAKY